MAKLEDLGKTAKILEHRLAINTNPPSALSAPDEAVAAVSSGTSTNICNSNKNNIVTTNPTTLNKNVAQNYASNGTQNGIATTSSVNNSADSWKTKFAKRDKRRQKEIMIKAGAMPGNMGEKSVEELENFIKVSHLFLHVFGFSSTAVNISARTQY